MVGGWAGKQKCTKAPKTRWTLWRGRAWGEYFREHGSNSNADNATSFVRSNNVGVVVIAAAATASRRQQSHQLQQLQQLQRLQQWPAAGKRAKCWSVEKMRCRAPGRDAAN